VGDRKAQRKIKRLSITFNDGTNEGTGTSSDFSTTGLFIRTRKPLKPGTALDMVLELSENHTVALTGIVVRAIKTGIRDFKNGMGVKLNEIPKDYEDFINSLLQ
jgi:Tfp pilus assembly protein PilZ